MPQATSPLSPGTPGAPGLQNFQLSPSGNPLQPGITDFTPGTADSPSTITYGLPTFFRYPTQFLSQLQAQVQSGNAKILTDPTMVVQEGEEATVALTQEVVGNITNTTTSTNSTSTQTVTANIVNAGLTLDIKIERIDDNGFVTLTVNPTIATIGSTQNITVGRDTNQIALLNTRTISSGRIRLRDGQTLILSGIITEADRTTVTKVPILGDIPILGALFRATSKQNERQEVIVMLTPQIMDDSDRATFGYGYTPGPEVRRILNQP
ncbi:type II secretion system protein GspD [Neosynechococcus sphagnicola]|uniref:type II secretion system protein GspD n=1 Tax=Neosynechococcus sphagnicola TaxID=1501145 RepID=UPI001EF9D5D1|nr:hypothetical protein [Neosynechococcus sphagnicola]